MHISAFDAWSASSADLDACVRLHQAAAAIDRPAEPAPVRSAYVAHLTRVPAPGWRYLDWLARSTTTGELTGIASLMLLATSRPTSPPSTSRCTPVVAVVASAARC
jgi:hypothetical protein